MAKMPRWNIRTPAYYLPIMYLFLGQRVEKLGDLEESLQAARGLLADVPTDGLWFPYLGATLDSGVATLIAEETIEVLRYLAGPNPVEGIWLGFADDAILRLQGIKLVDGRMPGFAAIVGATETNQEAVDLVRSLQERNILVFMAGNAGGRDHCRPTSGRKDSDGLGHFPGTVRQGNHLGHSRPELRSPVRHDLWWRRTGRHEGRPRYPQLQQGASLRLRARTRR